MLTAAKKFGYRHEQNPMVLVTSCRDEFTNSIHDDSVQATVLKVSPHEIKSLSNSVEQMLKEVNSIKDLNCNAHISVNKNNVDFHSTGPLNSAILENKILTEANTFAAKLYSEMTKKNEINFLARGNMSLDKHVDGVFVLHRTFRGVSGLVLFTPEGKPFDPAGVGSLLLMKPFVYHQSQFNSDPSLNGHYIGAMYAHIDDDW